MICSVKVTLALRSLSHTHTLTFNYIWITSTLQRMHLKNTIPISSPLCGHLDPYFTVWWMDDVLEGEAVYAEFVYQEFAELNLYEKF